MAVTVRKTDSIVFRASELASDLAARASPSRSPSLVAKRDLDRYYETLRRLLPSFSRAEALALCDVLNGIMFPDPPAVALVWANVADAAGMVERHGIDQAALVERLRSLSYAEACAVVDACERFWLASAAGATVDAALRASGLTALSEEDTHVAP